jgi:hypothetical protein
MFVQVLVPVVSAIIDIYFLQTKQRPTGITGTSKYAGGASILMSWCFAFAKYSRDLYMAKVISWTFSKESSQSKDSVMSKKIKKQKLQEIGERKETMSHKRNYITGM